MICIEDKALCCGCAACANACPRDCIDMVPDSEGCEYPVVDESVCVSCDACIDACPILNPVAEVSRGQRAFLFQHYDPAVLLESTSGGAFTAIAEEVLERNGVVYGAVAFEQGDAGLNVAHCAVERKDDLARFRNSKYVQSEIGLSFRQAKGSLEAGRTVLFSGTPCQVEGLLRYLGHPYPNLVAVDVVCRAVPCRAVFRAYQEWLNDRFEAKTSSIRFRDKSRYGYRYSNICAFENDNWAPFSAAGVESDPFLRAFFSDVCDRPACYSCAFKKRYRMSDITLWDCFDVGGFSKDFNDNRGVTRVLVHSEKGLAMIQGASRYARVFEINAEQAVEGANEIVNPVALNRKRDEFMADVAMIPGFELMEKWFPDSIKVKFERFSRKACERLGVYDFAKRCVKKVLKR